MADTDISIEEARARMIAKRFGGNAKGASTGGGGTVRRKKKGSVKNLGDDKKLGSVLKKIGMTPLNGVEEVNIFKSGGEVIHITQPKIQASIPSNTYVVSGNVEIKQLGDLMPGILNQLGPESLAELRSYAASMQGGQGAAVEDDEEEEDDDDDDDVPDLVENFEEAAAK